MPPDSLTSPKPSAAAVHRTELIISTLLRIGVWSSLALVVLGTIFTFVHHPDYLTSRTALRTIIGDPANFPHTLGDMLRGIAQLRGQSIIILGLVLLIATPVLRVAVSIVAFAIQKDRIYVLITSIVLALLLTSFLLGKAG
jgi:uncharacterized membrane protein